MLIWSFGPKDSHFLIKPTWYNFKAININDYFEWFMIISSQGLLIAGSASTAILVIVFSPLLLSLMLSGKNCQNCWFVSNDKKLSELNLNIQA